MMKTLNELGHLRDSGFGRPRPRHGLKLLYWFSNDCVFFGNGNIMLSECDPANRDFGFHLFQNRYDHNGHKLLPDINFPYYVALLNSAGAKELPDYVSEDKSPDKHNSNTDRIIVSLYNEDCFDRVYVTQHHDRSNYDPNATYRISKGLLMNIRRRSLEDFLEEMGYNTSIQTFLPTPVFNYRPQTTNTVRPDFTAVNPLSSYRPNNQPPATHKKETKVQLDDNKKTCYYTSIQPFLATLQTTNYSPQTTNMVSPELTAVTPSSRDPAHNEPPATQNNENKIHLDDNKETGYCIQPVSRKPVISYRPQTTNTVSPELTAVTPSSRDPAHNEPPATQNSENKIHLDDNKETGYCIQPVSRKPDINYRPKTTNKVSPDFITVTPSSSDLPNNEPPATQNNETKIQIDDDTSTQHPSEKLPKKKGLCNRFCTIL